MNKTINKIQWFINFISPQWKCFIWRSKMFFWNRIIFQLLSLQYDAGISNVKPTFEHCWNKKLFLLYTKAFTLFVQWSYTRHLMKKVLKSFSLYLLFAVYFFRLASIYEWNTVMKHQHLVKKKKWKNGAFTSYRHFHCSHLFRWWESIPLSLRFDPTFHFRNPVCHGTESEKSSDSRVINIWAKHVSAAKTWRKHKLIVDNMDHEHRTENIFRLGKWMCL